MISCDVIRDLLPLYADDLLSQSRGWIGCKHSVSHSDDTILVTSLLKASHLVVGIHSHLVLSVSDCLSILSCVHAADVVTNIHTLIVLTKLEVALSEEERHLSVTLVSSITLLKYSYCSSVVAGIESLTTLSLVNLSKNLI